MEQQKKFGILTAFIAALLFGRAPLGKPLLNFLADFQFAACSIWGLLRRPVDPGCGRFRVALADARKDALRLSGAILFGGILGLVFLLAGLRIAAQHPFHCR